MMAKTWRLRNQRSRWRNCSGMLGGLAGSLLSICVASSVQAAERISVSYGPLQRSIAVDALEAYAKTGEVDEQLDSYLDALEPQQLEQIRQVLQTQIPLNEVEVSQFLYSPIGEELLQRITVVIKTDAPQAKFYALRSALILAAADPEGLTPLTILRHFPLEEMRIDLTRGLGVVESVQQFLNQTQEAIAEINQESALQASNSSFILPPTAPALEEAGSVGWEQRTITVTDRSRDRSIPVDLYLPSTSRPHPVIVISHGLGSDRSSFAYLAAHLASYGFVVAVPEHRGSNAEQLEALLSGRADEVASPNEFVDRPLDVTYLLNELEHLSRVNPRLANRVNLQQVGVVGQSFGGYTALALAGATIQPQQLADDCPTQTTTLNPSLFLQCLALQLPANETNLSDPRIKAAIAINPVASSVFGATGLEQIKVPVMIISGSADRVAPSLPEQIQPFGWLTSPSKYLVLMNGGTHFSTIGESPNAVIPVPPAAIGPSPRVAQQYVKALNTAFFQTYLAGQSDYQPYLSAAYAETISQTELPLSLIQE